MIDFQNAGYVKLGPVPLADVESQVQPLLVEAEELYAAFKGMRDYIAFTSKRIIAVNVQGDHWQEERLHLIAVLEDPGLLCRVVWLVRSRCRARVVVLRPRQGQVRVQGKDRRRLPQQIGGGPRPIGRGSAAEKAPEYGIHMLAPGQR